MNGFTSARPNLIIVGEGGAGLAAALAAAEAAHGFPIGVTLLDKAAEDEAGGNTRWTPVRERAE